MLEQVQRSTSQAAMRQRPWRQYVKMMGPGVVSGAANNDPAGVATYLQVGATTGFGLLWLLLVSAPMLYVLQEMSNRLGTLTKRGIAALLRSRYGRIGAWSIVVPLVLSNTISVGADLAGASAAIQLVTGIHRSWWVIPLAVFLGYTLIVGSYRTISRGLLWLAPLFVMYVVTGVMIRPPWAGVLHATLVPSVRLTPGFAETALGLLGATLSPYVFFWQATEAVKRRRTRAELSQAYLDIAIGASYVNVIFWFIIVVSGVLLFGRGVGPLTIAEAASTLRPLAGPAAGTLFACGIIVSGLLSIPVMVTSSANALAEVMQWQEGLDKSVKDARGFYLILAGAIVAGCAIALSRVSPFALMFWSQVLGGFLLPPLLIVLLVFCNDRRLLDTRTNSLISNLVAAAAVVITLWLAGLTASHIF